MAVKGEGASRGAERGAERPESERASTHALVPRKLERRVLVPVRSNQVEQAEERLACVRV